MSKSYALLSLSEKHRPNVFVDAKKTKIKGENHRQVIERSHTRARRFRLRGGRARRDKGGHQGPCLRDGHGQDGKPHSHQKRPQAQDHARGAHGRDRPGGEERL